MAKQKLTDKTAATVLNLSDLIHIVDISDTTSDPQGTSKKATLTQIKTLFGGPTAFLGLTDTPANYTGAAGKAVQVNAGGTGLEFVTAAGSNIYTTDGTILAGRVATLTDTLEFSGGTVTIKGANDSSGSVALAIKNDSGDDILKLENDREIFLGTSLNNRIRSATNGGFRIIGGAGNTSTSPAFGFFSTNGIDDGAGGNGWYRPITANTQCWATSNYERMRLTSGGNFGIGTGPIISARLHVKGVGATSSTSALKMENSLGGFIFRAQDDGKVFVGEANNSGGLSGASLTVGGTSNGAIRFSSHASGYGIALGSSSGYVNWGGGNMTIGVSGIGFLLTAGNAAPYFAVLGTTHRSMHYKLGASSTANGDGHAFFVKNSSNAEQRVFTINNRPTSGDIVPVSFENITGLLVGGNLSGLAASAILQADSTTQGFLPPRNADPAANITSPATGLMVYDTAADRPYFNGTTGWRPIGDLNGLYAQTVVSSTINTTGEQSIVGSGVGSLTVPANLFRVGDSFHAKIGGKITSTGGGVNSEITVKIKTGPVILATTGTFDLDTATAEGWECEIDFTLAAIGVTGSICTNGNFAYTKTNDKKVSGHVFQDVQTINTAAANTLDITVEWNTLNGGDEIYSANFVLYRTYTA